MNFTLIMITFITLPIIIVTRCIVKSDIIRCSKCPFNQSLQCYTCKRECNINENRYNRVKL